MAFVVSSGALRDVERSTAPAPTLGMRTRGNTYRDYATLWRTQPELRTVVDFLARNIAHLGLHVFRRVSDVDRIRLTDHPLATLLGQPNTRTTPYELIDALVHDMCIFDSAFWLKIRDGGQGPTLALRRIRPGRIRPTGSDWLEPEGYEIIGSRGKLEVAADSVVHFHGYNPDDGRTGSSPIESLRQVLSEEWAANVYREQLWRNGARLSGYISRPVDSPDWGDKGRKRFREEWQAQFSGNSDRAGETAILEDGMSFVPSAVTPRDSQYIESRKLTREEVARSYHVPLPMVGILDHATFTNIKELHKNLYQDCLGPWLESFQQVIELQLVPDLPDTANVYVEFNFAAKLNGSFEEQAAQLQSAIGSPYMTRNEGRARLNLPMIAGGDELITPLNVAVGGGQAPLPLPGQAAGIEAATHKALRVLGKARAPQEYTDKATETLAKFFARQGAAVLSQLGAQKSRGAIKASAADIFDTARWDGELAADLLLTSRKIAVVAAQSTMADIGQPADQFDPGVMAGWLAAHADGAAKAINAVTVARLTALLAEGLDDVMAAVGALFDTYHDSRAAQIATTLTSAMSGFGTVEAGRHHGGEGATKTWRTGSNPRPEHAAMDGETVPIDDAFSDGSRWPGGSGDAALDTNCNCDVSISVTA